MGVWHGPRARLGWAVPRGSCPAGRGRREARGPRLGARGSASEVRPASCIQVARQVSRASEGRGGEGSKREGPARRCAFSWRGVALLCVVRLWCLNLNLCFLWKASPVARTSPVAWKRPALERAVCSPHPIARARGLIPLEARWRAWAPLESWPRSPWSCVGILCQSGFGICRCTAIDCALALGAPVCSAVLCSS